MAYQPGYPTGSAPSQYAQPPPGQYSGAPGYGAPGVPQLNPYGLPGVPQSSPYGVPQPNPYGSPGVSQSSPYGAPQPTPYGAPQPNPYGTSGAPQQTMYGAPPTTQSGYRAAPAADPMWASFSAVAGADQKIDAVELCKCLSQSGFTGSYKPFTQETCKILITLLDRDRSGTMEFSEYKELWTVLAKWKQTFETLDKDRSGALDAQEISTAITSFGYRLSPTALAGVMQRYNTNGKVYFDDFIALTTRVRSLSIYFMSRDTNRQGSATLSYDDFMTHTMSC